MLYLVMRAGALCGRGAPDAQVLKQHRCSRQREAEAFQVRGKPHALDGVAFCSRVRLPPAALAAGAVASTRLRAASAHAAAAAAEAEAAAEAAAVAAARTGEAAATARARAPARAAPPVAPDARGPRAGTLPLPCRFPRPSRRRRRAGVAPARLPVPDGVCRPARRREACLRV